MPAAWAYVDTSVLVKRYIQEPGSTHARALLRRHRLLVSALAPVEMLSSLSRRRTEGDLAERHFQAIVSRMQHDRAYWEVVEVNPLVLNKAEELVARTSHPDTGCHPCRVSTALSELLAPPDSVHHRRQTTT